MINGDVNIFLENLYYGNEMNFAYADKQYFIQGWTKNKIFTLELCQTIPITTNEGYCIWKYSSNDSQEVVSKFLEEKLFNGKTFWAVEQEIEWLEEFPIDDVEETKIYYMKHPEDINLPNTMKIDLTPKKISEMDENFQKFVKRIITKTGFGSFTNAEFYGKSGKIMTGVEFLTWYFAEGFKYNEFDWKSNNLDG